ncbi:hypothetical protein R5R35_009100 [Gryllus longicercus]|uniref:Osiris 2 n=1 Tax=Gryllus longicercus TaxID=2509291 RepID=A0AAN9VXJ8_9ORTH
MQRAPLRRQGAALALLSALALALALAPAPAAADGPPANGSRVTFGDERAPGEGRSLGEGLPLGEGRSLGGLREGKNLLDWIGLGTGPETDPYLAEANAACLTGDLAECFKSRALASLDDFFDRDAYPMTENARVVRLPRAQLRSLHAEPFEFSVAPRADEPEWDKLVKFLLRRAERFLKSTALELQFPAEVTQSGRYSPRFIDEINSELDILEDKTASPFSRKKLKRLFVPLLVILKLFKLKLLLFLPLILGLASFKKVLGLLALVVPGLIGFFKLCKPDLQHNYGSFGHSSYYHKPPSPQYSVYPSYGSLHGSGGGGGYYGSHYARDAAPAASAATGLQSSGGGGGVAFRDDAAGGDAYDAHRLAYSGYHDAQ